MPDAMSTALRARADLEVTAGLRTHDERAELLAIDETITKHRPRQLDGEEPDQAQHWLAAGFDDDAVVAWIEAGVSCSVEAALLHRLGVAPREVAVEYETDVTLGLALVRGEVTIDQVLELRRAAREVY